MCLHGSTSNVVQSTSLQNKNQQHGKYPFMRHNLRLLFSISLNVPESISSQLIQLRAQKFLGCVVTGSTENNNACFINSV
jgi:hypothetical protein